MGMYRSNLAKVTCLGALVAVSLLCAATSASAETQYSNVPNPLPGNLPSQGFQATQTAELGGQIHLAGTERQNATVTVGMSSWACQTGGWDPPNRPCVTTPGSTFTHPITLNVYSVGSGNSVGDRLISITKRVAVPFRPSQDDTNCTGSNAGAWFDPVQSKCVNGKLFTTNFALGDVTLPDNVIVSVAFNTDTWGYDPIGTPGPYDSLNLALTDGFTNPSGTAPSTGSDPIPDSAYENSHTAANYCDGGSGGVDTFRLDANCWTGFQPILAVATPAQPSTGGGQSGSGGTAGQVGSGKSKKCKKKKKSKKASIAKKCKKHKKKK
jgi:hypothetical protein